MRVTIERFSEFHVISLVVGLTSVAKPYNGDLGCLRAVCECGMTVIGTLERDMRLLEARY